MKTAVIVFPGSNCEHDTVHALESVGAEAELVWHRETDLSDFDGAILPGGFAHGDYLRTGAIARFSPIMPALEKMADEGKPVVGICNGFQILCEAGLLPGVLLQNRFLKFICRDVHLRVENTSSVLTRAATPGQVLRIPLNSYEGNFTVTDDELARLEDSDQILFRYASPDGRVDDGVNPNGSMANIAAVANGRGNVGGIMPHPERASETVLGSSDGRVILESFVASLEPAVV